MIDAKDILKSMRPIDAKAFKDAARLFDCYILVRRSNPASREYIGRSGFTPKRLDAKFKTADFNIDHMGLQRRLNLAGLVVNPLMDREFQKAFEPKKFITACKIWRKEHASVVAPVHSHSASGVPNYVWMTEKPYCVYSDPASDRYGCLLFVASTPVTGGKFIHGDYDLYGIVPRENPARNIVVQEKVLGQSHARGAKFQDVQLFVNSRMGVPMVLHGSQEKFKKDLDDDIDVFYPDGTIKLFSGVREIKALYENEFEGRKMYTDAAELREVLGRFVEVV